MYKETFLNLIEKDKNIPFFIIEKENYSFLESHKIQKILGVGLEGDKTANFFEFCPKAWHGIFRGTFLELEQLDYGASLEQKLYYENGTHQKIEIINDKKAFIVKLHREGDLNNDVSFLKLTNHLLLKYSDDAIFIIDKQLKVLFYNNAAKDLGKRLLGKVENITSKMHYFLEKYERLKIGVSAAFKGEEFHSELSYYIHSGEQVFLKTHYQPIYLQGQEVEGCLIRSKDITTRSTVEEMFSSMLEQSNIGYSIIDTDLKIVKINKYLRTLLQYSDHEIIGKKFTDFIHSSLRAHFLKEFQLILSSSELESPHKLFIDLSCKYGTTLLFELQTRKVRISDKKYAVFATLKNVTQKEQNNQMLKEMQRLIKACGWVYDRFSKTMNVTEEVAQVIGISQEFIYKNPTALLSMCDEKSYDKARKALLNSYRTQSDFDLELLIKGKYRGEQWIRLTGRPIIRHSKVVGLYGGIQDISTQKKQLGILERNETYIDEIQRVTHVGNWVYEPNEERYYWSDHLYTLLNLNKSKGIPSTKTQLNYIDKHYRILFRDAIKRLSILHKPIDLDVKCSEKLFKATQLEFLNIQGRAIYDQTGNLLRFVGAVTDITERKRIEELSKSKKIWLKSMINAAKDSFIAEFSGRVVNYNKGLQRLLGFSNYFDLRGKVFLDFFHEQDHNKILEYRNNCRIGDVSNPSKIEVKMRKRDSSYVDVELSANLAKIQGKLYTIFNAHDITKRKEYEQGLLAKNEELKETNKELDRFLYSTTHDLKGPITSLKGLLNLAYKEKPEEVMKTYLPMMDKNVDRVLDLIKDFGEFLRNNRQQLEPKSIDLFSELKLIIDSHQFYLSNDFVINLDISTEHLFVSDRIRLRSILTNLFTNSIKYSDDQKDDKFLNIVIRDYKEGIEIQFEDNGEGISETDQHKVFDMFYRASEYKEGTGLGLFIVKEAVEILGGKIDLISEKGLGCNIKVYLPTLMRKI
ncbi:PAS domain S-box protein [Flammeovirga aprica]|uniref:histidine kinase n=1 Tax=Flammeovirga aprica JL-4 TaxID=694437 RepID=A0A7X9RTK5_9BACT|nr:PAS domain S-box protein [Flammeovirga aprica]NME67352.1 PAS domain S-box protein [Flammeovirga aprica JL-4]